MESTRRLSTKRPGPFGFWDRKIVFVLAITILMGFQGSIAIRTVQARQIAGKPTRIAFLLDVSSSMTGEKLEHLKQSTSYAIALVDGSLSIIAFSDSVRTSGSMLLEDGDARRGAMDYVNRLKAGGGTDYLAALKELGCLPKGTATLFVSDGENANGTNADVLEAVDRAPGPIFTVGIETTDKAQGLLTQMAARTGGASVKVDSAEELTRHILKMVQCFGDYWSFRPTVTDLVFTEASRDFIVVGYNVVPAVEGTPSIAGSLFEHHANLPDEDAFVSRVFLPRKTDVRLKVGRRITPQGRLAAVMRNDLPRPRHFLQTNNGTVRAGQQVVATTEFFDREGNRIDPRGRSDLVAVYVLQDDDERTITKVSAKPSASKPALTAKLPVPDTPGPVTVLFGSGAVTEQGHRFRSYDQQTILVKESTQLKADPAFLSKTTAVGLFSVSTKIRAADGKAMPGSLDVELRPANSPIRLRDWTLKGGLLQLDMTANNEGIHSGEIHISDTRSDVVEPLSVPFRFSVRTKYLGLKLAKSHDLGLFPAGSGRVELAALSVESLDAKRVDYSVRISDLSNSNEVIPLSTSKPNVSPTTGHVSMLDLVAEISDVSPGIYRGNVTFVLNETSPPKSWDVALKLVVIGSLVIDPVDFGDVAPGMIRTSSIVLRNEGGELRGLSLKTHEVKAEGGMIQISEDDFPVVVAAKSTTNVPVELVVSPLVTSRGVLTSEMKIMRPGGHAVAVPVRINLKDEAPSDLIVSPGKVDLDGVVNEVVSFHLSFKVGPDANRGDQLTIEASPLADMHGTSSRNRPVIEWVSGNQVSANQRVAAKGFLVAPAIRGDYSSKIKVTSSHSGVVTVPLTLVVR